jgi:hypothetical protein
MWKEWRAQPEAARPAFVEACLGYMVIDFLALCQGAGPSVSPLSSLRSAAGGRLLRPLVSRACRPQTHALPRPPEPRAARTRSAARCEGSSRKHGIIAESAPERSESCRQRVQMAAQGGECGVFSTSAVSQRQRRACPPEPPFGVRLECRHRPMSPSGGRIQRSPPIRPRGSSHRSSMSGWRRTDLRHWLS